ncbi:hypothetical protein GE118_00455 [Mycoplasma sp. NEAQ87857]|uniref:hypothetical protein n=1 Tax=Mycoplasma sp. NEAQ87857 TaxID=2683967 RepID=UPI001315D2FE|nr:hypothetical protein [Mycoplasma sp. NEAQ87857]QGZ97275.1 hypothetical protein GE118_00455 [Mycoplasma sp. NEAQ87857]
MEKFNFQKFINNKNSFNYPKDYLKQNQYLKPVILQLNITDDELEKYSSNFWAMIKNIQDQKTIWTKECLRDSNNKLTFKQKLKDTTEAKMYAISTFIQYLDPLILESNKFLQDKYLTNDLNANSLNKLNSLDKYIIKNLNEAKTIKKFTLNINDNDIRNSFLLYLTKELAYRMQNVAYIDLVYLENQLKTTTFSKENFLKNEQWVKNLVNVKYLILDNLGTKNLNEWFIQILVKIIDKRLINKKPIIIGVNNSNNLLELCLKTNNKFLKEKFIVLLNKIQPNITI